MRLDNWTIIYKTNIPKKTNILSFCLLGVIADECLISLNRFKCNILIKTSILEREIKKQIKLCILEQAEQIADIISWKYGIQLSEPLIYKGNKKRIKTPTNIIRSDKNYKNLFPFAWSDRNIKILKAYREIMNETSDSLKFIMSYRLMEVFSKENKVSVDNFILELFPNIPTVAEKRSGKKKVNVLTHNRNKIHATDNKYSFPYKFLNEASKEMDLNLRKILELEFSKNISTS